MSSEDLPIALAEEEIETITWRVKMLVEQAGFDTYWAGALASIFDLDWREAKHLRKKGCPQNLVYELLR